MKKFWAAILAVILIAGGLYLFVFGFPRKTAAPVGATTVSPAAATPTAPKAFVATKNATALDMSQTGAVPIAVSAFSPTPHATVAPETLPPSTIMENMRSTIRLYGSRFGGNPVGTNPEITAALTGNNPKQINFIQPESGLRINEQGELVDPWGTPFFFHQLSGSETEIHSAGPDRKLWTADDLVTK